MTTKKNFREKSKNGKKGVQIIKKKGNILYLAYYAKNSS
jgi:hypothetical protein